MGVRKHVARKKDDDYYEQIDEDEYSEDEVVDKGAIIGDDDFQGPVKSRRITDPLFSLLIIIAWIASGRIGHWAFQNGDPVKVIHPSDYKGRYCERDEDENGRILPPLYHPVDILGNGICVEKCPQQNIFNPTNRSQLLCKDEKDLSGMLGCASEEGTIINNTKLLVICGGCLYQTESIQIMNFCVPKLLLDLLNQVDQAANQTGFNSADSLRKLYVPQVIPQMERFINDIWVSKNIILGFGVGGSVVMGFIFLFSLNVPGLAAILIWGAAIFTPALFLLGGYYSHHLAAFYKRNPIQYIESEHFTKFTEYLSYFLYAVAGIILCILVFLRRKIMLAIALTKVAAKAVIAFPFSILYPLIQITGYLAFLIPWCSFMIYLAGAGKPVQHVQEVFTYEITYTTYEYTQNIKIGFIFLLFVLFWTSEYIVAIGQITLAMCYSKWYFTADKSNHDSNILSCMCISLIYHNGTAAFGSMLLGMIRLLRVILAWVQKKLRKVGQNKMTEVVMCCFQCCLGCLESCLKYLSKNAYIQTALRSYSFCKASRASFTLIYQNATRMFAIGAVSQISMIYCKLFIISSISISSFFFITRYHDEELHSDISVVLVVTFLSWFVANLFLEVLEIATTTILHCFLADEEMNPDGSCFVPDELDDFLQQVGNDK